MCHSGLSRLPHWFLVLLIGVLLLVACGKGSSQTPVATTGVQSGEGGKTQASQPPTAASDVTRPVNSLNPCDSFGMLGAMAAGFSAQTAGANMETSGTPNSEFAENVEDFAVGSLQEALEGDVSAGCFMEFSSDGQTGSAGNNAITLSYAFQEPSPSSVDGASAFTRVIEELGGSVTFSMSAAEGTTAAFEKVEIGGLTLSGTLSLSENNIAALLTSGG